MFADYIIMLISPFTETMDAADAEESLEVLRNYLGLLFATSSCDLNREGQSNTQNVRTDSECLFQDLDVKQCSKSHQSPCYPEDCSLRADEKKLRNDSDNSNNFHFTAGDIHSNGETLRNQDYSLSEIVNKHVPAVEIKQSSQYGRFLVASRDVAAGEVLFQEDPLLVIPKAGSETFCLSCLKVLTHEWQSCGSCGAPLCFQHCAGKNHTASECTLLKRLGFKEAPHIEVLIKDLSVFLGPLRALLMTQKSSAVSKLFFALQSHKEQRMKLPIGRFIEEHIIGTLRSRLGLEVTPETIHHLCGVLDTNAFEVSLEDGHRGRAIFILASMMNHSCLPNAQRWYSDGKMTVRAAVSIPKSSPILINYTQTLWGTQARVIHLYGSKMFFCRCRRCMDPTELGTQLSFVRCRECPAGLLVPPHDPQKCWQCRDCGTRVSGQAMEALIQAAAVSLSHLPLDDLAAITSRLSHLSRVLGHNHYIVAQMKYAFLQATIKLPLQGNFVLLEVACGSLTLR